MTVIVTKLSGGISQLFNPDTGKITYKSKIENALLEIDAFDGIVKFNQKGSKAIVSGKNTSVENCEIIKKDQENYQQVKKEFLENTLKEKQEQYEILGQKIEELKKQFS